MRRGSLLVALRVTQYWDAKGITGTHFAETDLGGPWEAGRPFRGLRAIEIRFCGLSILRYE